MPVIRMRLAGCMVVIPRWKMGLLRCMLAFTGVSIVVIGSILYQFEIAQIFMCTSYREYMLVIYVSVLVSYVKV